MLLPDWPDEVVVSALNCAEQEACADFGIEGTPTVRLFMPNAEQGDQGVDLRAHSGVKETIFLMCIL